MITFEELKARLAEELDEVGLVELLNITSFDLVDLFQDRVEDLWLTHRLDDFCEDRVSLDEE